VNHALGVRVVEGIGDRRADHRHVDRREGVTGLEHLLERPTLDVLHRDVREAGLLVHPSVVHRDDHRMVEDAGSLRLAQESLGKLLRLVGVDRDGQRLERDAAPDHGVDGEVDDAHRPLAEHALDDVAAELLGLHGQVNYPIERRSLPALSASRGRRGWRWHDHQHLGR
jgi:hypothetical protein